MSVNLTNKIFVDTSFIVASVNKSDEYYHVAKVSSDHHFDQADFVAVLRFPYLLESLKFRKSKNNS